MSMRRRLERLEERAGEVDGDQEEHIISEAISRATDEDLELLWEYLDRNESEGLEQTEDEDGGPTPEEWAAIERYFQLREEARRGLYGGV